MCEHLSQAVKNKAITKHPVITAGYNRECFVFIINSLYQIYSTILQEKQTRSGRASAMRQITSRACRVPGLNVEYLKLTPEVAGMIKKVAKVIKALNGNIKKTQIAGGFAWGLILGLIPAGNFFWIVMLLVSFFFNHHHGSKFLIMAVVKLFAPLTGPPLDLLGWEILHFEPLVPLFTTMYNMPFVPFTGFNNTLVAGGIAAGIILSIPLYFALLPFIDFYRKTLGQKIKNSIVVQSIIKFPLFKAVDKAIKILGKDK